MRKLEIKVSVLVCEICNKELSGATRTRFDTFVDYNDVNYNFHPDCVKALCILKAKEPSPKKQLK